MRCVFLWSQHKRGIGPTWPRGFFFTQSTKPILTALLLQGVEKWIYESWTKQVCASCRPLGVDDPPVMEANKHVRAKLKENLTFLSSSGTEWQNLLGHLAAESMILETLWMMVWYLYCRIRIKTEFMASGTGGCTPEWETSQCRETRNTSLQPLGSTNANCNPPGDPEWKCVGRYYPSTCLCNKEPSKWNQATCVQEGCEICFCRLGTGRALLYSPPTPQNRRLRFSRSLYLAINGKLCQCKYMESKHNRLLEVGLGNTLPKSWR